MGLKIAIDSHSNIASPATVSSDGNAFQVYIGDPGEFPFLRNRAVQIQPGYENHVEVSAIQISANLNIVSHSIEDRKCQFNWEGELEFHADYSYTSCVIEFALSKVGEHILTQSTSLVPGSAPCELCPLVHASERELSNMRALGNFKVPENHGKILQCQSHRVWLSS